MQRLTGGCAVGRQCRIGDGKRAVAAFTQPVFYRAGCVSVTGRPQGDMPHGIGELRAGNGLALHFEAVHRQLVSRQEYIEGRTMQDLGIESSGRAGRDQDGVFACLLKTGLQRARCRVEIRRHGNQRLIGGRGRRVKQPAKRQHAGTHKTAYSIRPGQCAPLPVADKPLTLFDGGSGARSRASTQDRVVAGLR